MEKINDAAVAFAAFSVVSELLETLVRTNVISAPERAGLLSRAKQRNIEIGSGINMQAAGLIDELNKPG